MIQVTLCGLYATAVAVLITLGEQIVQDAKYIIYAYIIPGFSFVILTMSFAVYSWISKQLWYITHCGRRPKDIKSAITYEEWLEVKDQIWKKRSLKDRIWQYISRTLFFYVSIPFSLDNIYCYYFLLYISMPAIGLFRISDDIAIWHSLACLVGAQLIAALIGLRHAVQLKLVGSPLRQHLVAIGM